MKTQETIAALSALAHDTRLEAFRLLVQRGPDGLFAYVIQPDQTVQQRPIEIELQQGDTALVSRGLNEGEQVVVDGQSQLRPGSHVQPRQAPQARPQREGTVGADAQQKDAQQKADGPKADTPRRGR